MAIVRLKKLTFCGLIDDKVHVLKQLQRLGGLHLIPLREASEFQEAGGFKRENSNIWVHVDLEKRSIFAMTCLQCETALCLEVCPTGSRIFGNILDPDSEINHILQNKRVYVLKEDVGTNPRFYYFFD